MRVVSWNMNRLARSEEAHRAAWTYLREGLQADLALVQEAVPPADVGVSVYRAIGERPYNWGSAVVALRPDLTLRPRRRVPLADSLPAAVANDELPDSHPGASTVVDVHAGDHHLMTAISLYAQWEMMPGGKRMFAGPRLHRMLSDLTGVLSLARRQPVLLAGDFNVTTQRERTVDNEASAAFSRLRAWGLTDCIAHTRSSRPSVRCDCPDGDACSHVQTFRRSPVSEGFPTQLDYAFISVPFVSAVDACTVGGSAAAWELSDHCPLVLDINEQVLGAVRGREGA